MAGVLVMTGGMVGLSVLCDGTISAACISDVLGIAQADTNPYGVRDRPVPANTDPTTGTIPGGDMLLPVTAGTFSRTQLSGDAGNGWQAVYQGEGVTVTVTAQPLYPAREAQLRVQRVMAEGGAAETFATGLDPSFALITGLPNGAARFAWSRDIFFFDVQAPSRLALDAFMGAFPY